MDEEIRYTLNLVDNISPSLARVEASQGKLATQMETTTQRSDTQNLSFLTQVQAVRSVDMGFRGLTSVLITTGLVGGKTARQLQSIVLAIHGVSSAFQLLKGARMVLLQLQAAQIGNAQIETYRAGMHGKIALVGLAIGATAAATGYLIGQSGAGSSNTTNNVVFSPPGDSQSQREMAKGTLSIIGG